MSWPEHVSGCADSIVLDIWLMAEATYWTRRAAELEWARPKPRGAEFYGRATPEELSRRDAQLREEAEACRNRARLALIGGEF